MKPIAIKLIALENVIYIHKLPPSVGIQATHRRLMHMVFFIAINSHGVELVFAVVMDVIVMVDMLFLLATDMLNMLSAELVFLIDVLARHSRRQTRGWNSINEQYGS